VPAAIGGAACRRGARHHLRLPTEDGETCVELVIDYALAQFNSGGISQNVAARLAAQFAGNLRATLALESQPSPAPLDAGNMLARIIWNHLRRWLRCVFGRD
jgi:hypothetical protein